MTVTCRDQIQAWDLQSFLIKPVQRILKYPLLVNKLVETTPDKHPDRKAIQNAQDAISNMAQDINEIKRRKDIGESHPHTTHTLTLYTSSHPHIPHTPHPHPLVFSPHHTPSQWSGTQARTRSEAPSPDTRYKRRCGGCSRSSHR